MSSKKNNQQNKKKVAFIHPDLGIGGAEQLVINLALALKSKDVDVTIFTPYHDKNHCFKETIDGSLKVQVRGDSFPQKIMGRGTAICAMIRMVLATLYVLLFDRSFDIFVVDQVTTCLPLIWLFGKKSIFYCHFPDKLLCVERTNPLKKIYRFFIDILEEVFLFPANKILVNSEFTKNIYKEHFPLLWKHKQEPEVLYPSIDFTKFNSPDLKDVKLPFEKNTPFFFSLNRYERKKNINLAIKAFAKLQKLKNVDKNAILIIGGGYDEKVLENYEHHIELVNLAKELKVQDKVIFERNVSNELRAYYLQNAVGVLYTPSNEHFGIVPVEAMFNKTPVLGINNGGPKESIKDTETGFLLEQDESQWADKMLYLLQNPEKCKQMGEKGKQRVVKLFGFDSFTNQFYNDYDQFNNKNKKQK